MGHWLVYGWYMTYTTGTPAKKYKWPCWYVPGIYNIPDIYSPLPIVVIPKKPSRGLTIKEIQRRSNHLFKNMVCIARRMINDIGFLLIDIIKQVRVSQGVRTSQLKLWDPEAPWLLYVRSSEVVWERCSGREGGVVLSWKQKIGTRPKSFLPYYIFFSLLSLFLTTDWQFWPVMPILQLLNKARCTLLELGAFDLWQTES